MFIPISMRSIRRINVLIALCIICLIFLVSRHGDQEFLQQRPNKLQLHGVVSEDGVLQYDQVQKIDQNAVVTEKKKVKEAAKPKNQGVSNQEYFEKLRKQRNRRKGKVKNLDDDLEKHRNKGKEGALNALKKFKYDKFIENGENLTDLQDMDEASRAEFLKGVQDRKEQLNK